VFAGGARELLHLLMRQIAPVLPYLPR
jgi:hypothetical protein